MKRWLNVRVILISFFGIVILLLLFLKRNPVVLWNLRTAYLSTRCDYSTGAECSDNNECVLFEPTKAICHRVDSTSLLVPFPRQALETICTQGPRTAKGRSHSFLNTSYAADLATPKGKANSKLIAVFSGRVATNTGCNNQDDSDFNSDDCGLGFGNWVVLFNEDSTYMALYAHLRQVLVNDGDTVKLGQELGEEGKTGFAGHRHLHFSIHKNIWKLTPKDVKKYGIWLPPSIPWKTKIIEKKAEKIVSVDELPCEDNNDLTRKPFEGAL